MIQTKKILTTLILLFTITKTEGLFIPTPKSLNGGLAFFSGFKEARKKQITELETHL